MIRMFAAALGLSAVLSAGLWAQDGPAPVEPAAEAPPSSAAPVLRQVDPELTPLVCPFRGRVEYEPGAIECGLITVPENREVPNSRLIRLHYVKIAATGEDAETRREDPVIYLTGGPGVGVESYVGRLKDHPVAEHRDLYILEQRGIANSTDFCEQYAAVDPGLSYATSMEEMERAGAERMRACFREARDQGVDLTGYSTLENARDVAALRDALGFEQWNVWGISYGSHLGQMLLRVDPEGVRAMVIDAIVPNDLSGLMEYERIFTQVIENFTSTCTDLALCEGLEERLWRAMQGLQDDPVILSVEDPEVSPQGELWIPPAGLAYLPFSMAYEQSEHPAIPAVMDATIRLAETRDPIVLEGMAAAVADAGDMGGLSISQGMSDAIRCNDGYVHAQLAEVEALDDAPGRWEGLIYTREGARYTAQVCEEEGLAPRDRADYALVQTDRPTLIVNGAWDPVTPPWLAEYIHAGMPGSRYVEVPYAGHGPTRSMPDCAGGVLTAFFDDPDVDALDVSCLEAGVDAPVYQSLFTTTAQFRFLALTPDAPQSFLLPGLWLGLPALILPLAVLIFPLGFFGRLIDHSPVGDLAAETGGARLTGWLAALASATGVGMMAAGGVAASEISMTALIAGLAAPASTGAWLVLVGGGLGALSLILLTTTSLGGFRIRIGTLLGLLLTSLSAIALAGFLLVWDLAPF